MTALLKHIETATGWRRYEIRSVGAPAASKFWAPEAVSPELLEDVLTDLLNSEGPEDDEEVYEIRPLPPDGDPGNSLY